jgi:hypothetical protein
MAWLVVALLALLGHLELALLLAFFLILMENM